MDRWRWTWISLGKPGTERHVQLTCTTDGDSSCSRSGRRPPTSVDRHSTGVSYVCQCMCREDVSVRVDVCVCDQHRRWLCHQPQTSSMLCTQITRAVRLTPGRATTSYACAPASFARVATSAVARLPSACSRLTPLPPPVALSVHVHMHVHVRFVVCLLLVSSSSREWATRAQEPCAEHQQLCKRTSETCQDRRRERLIRIRALELAPHRITSYHIDIQSGMRWDRSITITPSHMLACHARARARARACAMMRVSATSKRRHEMRAATSYRVIIHLFVMSALTTCRSLCPCQLLSWQLVYIPVPVPVPCHVPVSLHAHVHHVPRRVCVCML